MNERLKKIRWHYKMSQEEFGKKIGIESRAHISALENGSRNITDRIIKDVCREFDINKDWFLTGDGEMLKEDCQEERFSVNIGKLQRTDSETIMRWVNAIAETKPEILAEIEKFMMKVLENQEEPE